MLVCVVLPGASWLDGSGRLSYPMFVDWHELRVRITAVDRDGRSVDVSPTSVASKVRGGAGLFLVGTERFHAAPKAREALRQLDAIARRVCQLGPYRSVRVAADARPNEAGPITTTEGSATCP